MFDLKKSFFSLPLEKPVAAGNVVAEEGLVLMQVLEDGVEKVLVSLAAPVAGIVAGFSLIANAQPDTEVKVLNLVVPAAAPLVGSLGATNVVTGSLRFYDATAHADLGVDETFAGLPASGDVKVDIATGALKFHADEHGHSLVAYLTYNMTVAESKVKYFQRNINNPAPSFLAQVGVGKGQGEIFTDKFDTSFDYSTGAALTVGANGLVSQGGAITIPAHVIAVPSVDSPFLGLAFNIM